MEYTVFYHQHVTALPPSPLPVSPLPLDTTLLRPGLRLAIGLSGGADSVALLRALAARSSELGIVLHAAHLNHGLRGAESDADQHFASELASSLGLVFHSHQVDTTAEASQHRETIEEAARRLRYTWFRQLMSNGVVDAVATAHTLDDQAETVLGKFLRGAWTEGLSGIHPVVNYPEGRILRPLLAATRPQIVAYLQDIGQAWREDSSNQDHAYTRNRLRHQLLPELEQWNPQIRQHLSNMAQIAKDEESWWQSELSRLAPQLILTGRPVRGGGRASTGAGTDENTLALDVVRVAALPPALQRRLLRHAADILGTSLSFDATETLRKLATERRAGQQLALPSPLVAERTPRELRLSRNQPKTKPSATEPSCQLPVPGEAKAFGLRFQAVSPTPVAPATIRSWKPGDRVTLRYSSGPRKVKEVLERLKVTGTDRANWPVVEWQGRIVWMQGAELQPTPELTISAREQ
jgi:tRNA(Ile)-lysidine synthase